MVQKLIPSLSLAPHELAEQRLQQLDQRRMLACRGFSDGCVDLVLLTLERVSHTFHALRSRLPLR